MSYFLPTSERLEALKSIIFLKIFSKKLLIQSICLQIARISTEVFGLGMLYPLIRFIENNQKISDSGNDAIIWSALNKFYAVLGLSINIFSLCATVFFLILLRQVVLYMTIVQTEKLKEQTSKNLRDKLYNKFLGLEYEAFKNFSLGDITVLFNRHCQAVGSILRDLVLLGTLYANLFILLIGLTYMSAYITLSCLLIGMILAASMYKFRQKARKVGEGTAASHDHFSNFVTDTYTGWKLIKLNADIAKEKRDFYESTYNLKNLTVAATAIANQIQLIFIPLTVGIALSILSFAIQFKEPNMAGLGTFLIIIVRMVPLFMVLMKNQQSFLNLNASLKRILDFNEELERRQETTVGKNIKLSRGPKIEFRDVFFTYKNRDAEVISNVNFTIPSGSITAIVGPSGAGKTTLIDHIPKLLRICSGNILIDDVDISEIRPNELRKNISYLSQNPYLFKGTVKENITFGLHGKSQKDIENACEKAGALEFIQKLDNGFDSYITPGGTNISGGQRQRLALSRAFLKAAPILIFDEPTSSLDFETENIIFKNLIAFCKSEGCSIVMITHRVQTALSCDNLIVVQNGQANMIEKFKNAKEGNIWLNKMLLTEVEK